MQLLQVLQVMSALVPVVRAGVELAEKTFGPGNGTKKLAAATASVEEALPKVAELASNIDTARAAVGPMIEATVAAANAAGAFRKSKRRPKRSRSGR